MNEVDSAKIARANHAMLRALRRDLDGRGFCELITGVLQDGEKRECMELYLRSALSGGMGAVYEIGSCFRGDDADSTHLPEFQMLELFWDRSSFEDLIGLTKDILTVAFGRDVEAFEVVDLAEHLPLRYSGFEYGRGSTSLRAWAKRYIEPTKFENCRYDYEIYNILIDQFITELRPGSVARPAMVMNYPMETICLAKPCDDHPDRIQRAEFFVQGLEIGHGFVDDMNAARVEGRMRANGSENFDAHFLRLLRSGRLPDSSGVGFGLDRLLMVRLGIDDIRDLSWNWRNGCRRQ